jgi:DedD protein
MGLFSFGNKERSAPRRSRAAGARASTRANANERRGAEADAMLLDPSLPEKQRARRRLVGAIALVVAAVVALPMILDSHPKPVTDDIAIDIPNRPATVRASNDDPDNTAASDDAPDGQAAPDKTIARAGAATGLASNLSPSASNAAVPPSQPLDTGDGQGTTNTSARAPQRSAPSAAPNTARKSATNASGTGIPDNVINDAAQSRAGNVPNNRASATPGTVADSSQVVSGTSAGNRYVVHLGWLDSDAGAHAWVSKLKLLGVPAYTERHRQADGTERMMLRAGPFPDRAAASAAVAKVREAGLSGGGAGSGNAAAVAEGPARRAP